MAVPKTQRSKAKQRSRRSQPDYKYVGMPELKILPSGKRVPRHMVTPDNPRKNGVLFIAPKKKKTSSSKAA